MAAARTSLNRKDLLLCFLLACFCAFLFRDIIFGRHLLFGDDFIAFYLGLKQFLYNEIHAHHSIPFWNPYIFSGIPFWAHFESTIFYPLDFLFWIMTPEKAYGYTMFMHLVLSAIFMYILARSFRISTTGSFVAAIAFSCNGFIMPTLYDGQMFRIQAYIWLPLIIFFVNHALTLERPFLSIAVSGLFWGLQILSGSAQDAFYTFLAVLLFLGCNLMDDFKDLRRYLKILAVVCALFLIGSGIAAIQLVPAFEFIGKSVRAAMNSYGFMTDGSYPPQGIITAVMPHFFGNYTAGNFWVSDVPWSVPLYNLYIGILPLVSLFFISFRDSFSRKFLTFTISLAVIAFLLALGSHTPIYRIVYLLPGFEKIRAPSKIIFLWVFAMSLLTGKGIDGLFSRSKTSLSRRLGLCLILVISLVLLDVLFYFDKSLVLKFFSPFLLSDVIPSRIIDGAHLISNEFHRFTLFAISIVLFILLWVRGILKYRLAAALLCCMLMTDLVYTNRGALKSNDKIYGWAAQTKRDLDLSLGRDKSIYRVGSFEFGMGANIEMYLGYQTVGGYTPLFLNRYYEYINRYRPDEGRTKKGWIVFFYEAFENSKLMDILNVKYEISYATKSYALRKTYLPRAFIVPACKILKKDEVLDYMIMPDFDPVKTVLFEKDDFSGDFPLRSLGEANLEEQVKIISYQPDRIVLATDSSAPGYLFLSEIFYPGWEAFVDDRPKRILRGNYLFRVIEIPKGRHEVIMLFDPLSIKIGIGITIFTLFMLINFIIFHFRNRSPSHKSR